MKKNAAFISGLAAAAAFSVMLLGALPAAAQTAPKETELLTGSNCACDCKGGPKNGSQGCVRGSAACAGVCGAQTSDAGTKFSCKVDEKACPSSKDAAIGVPMPLGNVNVAQAIGRALRVILGLTGSMALVMFIYGGFMYMTSAGNEERVTKGKKTLLWAILGLVVVFSAYAIVDFLIKQLTK